jgi:hypothetical protein
MDEEQGGGSAVTGAPRPFPAIDPEPASRYTWRTARRAGVALAAACAVAAAAWAGVRLTGKPATPATPAAGHGKPAAARFTPRGVIVFEQQPSGLLGTADADGARQVIASSAGRLDDTGLPVVSPDGRYLVSLEGQLITIGARGPGGFGSLPPPTGQAATSPGLSQWSTATFADGSRYVVATECDPLLPQAPQFYAPQSWLIPTGGGKARSLGWGTATAGDPASGAAIVSRLASDPAKARQVTCDAFNGPDRSLDLVAPGKPPATLVTAAALLRAAGWSPRASVNLTGYPGPDGGPLLVDMSQHVALPAEITSQTRLPVPRSARFLVSRRGGILAQVPPLLGELFRWSPDGRRLATCSAVPGGPSAVSVLAVTGTGAAATTGPTMTIVLPGRHDASCDQLLWSPDGTQLIYSATVNSHGLTASDRLQRGWTVIDLRTKGVRDVTAGGQPVAWLPAPKEASP